MKNKLYLVLFTLMMVGAGHFSNVKAAGTEPTQVDGVYQIATFDNLIWFAEQVNGGSTTLNAVLTADISQGADPHIYAPIGSYAHPYQGTFDGRGHSITLNLSENGNDYTHQGIFGCISDGVVIRNLVAKGVVKAINYVGGIAGSARGGNAVVTFENCGNEATVEGTRASDANAAGILGCNEGGQCKVVMTRCYNVGTITGSGSGALCGWTCNNGDTRSIFTQCYNAGQVNSGSGDFARNDNYSLTLDHCYYKEGCNSNYQEATDELERLSASDVTGGHLCDLLNDNETQTHWYQNAEEDYPLLFDHLPSNLNNYFFSFRHHADPTLGMVLGDAVHNKQPGDPDVKTMYYSTNCDPLTNRAALWTMVDYVEGGNHYNIVTGVADPEHFLHTEWAGNNIGHFYRGDAGNMNTDLYWGRVTPAYSIDDLSWTIQNGVYPNLGYLGPWDNGFTNGAEVALNKSGDAVGHFDIFKITRGEYVARTESEKARVTPVDISYIITNAEATQYPGKDVLIAHGWVETYEGERSNDYTFRSQNNGDLGNKSGAWYFEAWQGSGNLSDRQMSQSFTNMPAGKYKLSVRTNVTATGAKLFINDNEVELSQKAANGVVAVSITLATAGTLEIGVKLDDYQSNSVKFDDFRLTYSAPEAIMTELPDDDDLNDYFFTFGDHKSNMGLVLGDADKNGAGKAMFMSEDSDPLTNKYALWTIAKRDDYTLVTSPMYPELMFQTEQGQWGPAAWNYRTNNNGGGDMSWGNAVFTLDDASSSWTIQNGKYPGDSGEPDHDPTNFLGPWDGGPEMAFNVNENRSHFDILKIKRGKYVDLVETVNSPVGADISYIITNAEATREMQKERKDGVLGWKMEYLSATHAPDNYFFQTQNNDGLGNKSGDWFFETWRSSDHWKADQTPADLISDRRMYQEFSEMPAGQYKLTVRTDAEKTGAFLFINDVAVDMTNKDANGIVAVVANHTGGTLSIGVKLLSYQGSWIKFDAFHLEYSKSVEELPTTTEDLNDYFFSFSHHADPTLGLVLGDGIAGKQDAGSKTMLYSSNCDPLTNKNALWTMVEFENKNVIASPMYPEFMLQTENNNRDWYFHTSDNGGGGLGWGKAKFELTADGWTIQNGYYEGDRYLGPWDGADHFEDNAIVAFNKNGTATGHFDIYKIKKGEYVTRLETEKAKLGPVDISYIITNAEATRRNTVGWTVVGEKGFVSAENQRRNDTDDLMSGSGERYFDTWDNGGTLGDYPRQMYQTFTDMPDGQYTLTVITNATLAGAKLFINDVETELKDKVDHIATVTANVTGGTLRIGVKIEAGYSDTRAKFDNFQLTWSLVKPVFGEGRFILRNCGRKVNLTHDGDATTPKTAASTNFAGLAVAWDFVPSAFPDQYYIRNAENGRYIQWNTTLNGQNLPLLEDPLDATLFSFEPDTHVHEGCISLRIIGAPNDSPYLNAYGVGGQLGNYGEGGSNADDDWILFQISEPIPVAGTDYLIMNKQTGKYASAGATVNDRLEQTHTFADAAAANKGVWTLTALDPGPGFTIANAGMDMNVAVVNGNNGSGTFTAAGATWYIQDDPVDKTYSNISNSSNFEGRTCWNSWGGGVNDTYIGSWDWNSDGSRWRFIPAETYYLNALAYLSSLYDEDKKNKPFYLSESTYNTLKTAWTAAASLTLADKVKAANDMYRVLDVADLSTILTMPDGDYLVKNLGRNKYLHTNEKLTQQAAPHNSTYFWHVEKDDVNNEFRLSQCCYDPDIESYATDSLRWKEAKRYVAHEQGITDLDVWEYEDEEEQSTSYPISFDFYMQTAKLPYFGFASMLVGTSRMNGGDPAVITYNEKNNDCKWEFVTVEEASVSLIAAATKLITDASSGVFTLTADAKTAIQTAINNLNTMPNYDNYWTLENLLNAPSSYASLAEGRYLVRNYNYDRNRDGYVDDTETYLASLTNTMGMVEEALNYWCIWEVKKSDNGYTMQCEGNRLIHAPGHPLDGNPNTSEKDFGYLYYRGKDANNNDFFGVGKNWDTGVETAAADQILYIKPAAQLQMLGNANPIVGNFASISSQARPEKFLYQWTVMTGAWDEWIDNVVYANEYNPYGGDAWKTAFLWEFIPLTPEKESEIFETQVNGLAGYVGGVVTLSDVGSVTCLQDIVDLRDAAIEAINAQRTLNYTAPTGYDDVEVNDKDEVGALAFRAILDRINDIKRGVHGADTKKYYQDLRPEETLANGDKLKHPFFLESLCGTRPSYGARLTEGGGDTWTSRTKNEVVDNAGAFYVTRTRDEETDVNGIVTTPAQYQLANGNGWYLRHSRAAAENPDQILRTNTDNKMTFEIDAVIPGVWKIKDMGVTSPSKYVTLTAQYGGTGGLQYYDRVEISTLWKFQTFNELDTIFVRKGQGGTNANKFFCTYSNSLNVKIPKNGNPVPYYCSGAYYHTKNDDPQKSAALKVELTRMPDDGTYYYLKHDEGYLFIAEAAGAHINDETHNPTYFNPSYENAIYIPDAEYMTGFIKDVPCYSEEAYERNLFVGNASWPITITAENWRDIYALGYASTTTQVGSYLKEPVFGIGMGFYHIKLGKVLKAGQAYIPSGAFQDGDFEPITAVHESGIPVEMLFEDEDGNVVDCIELKSDGTMERMADGPVYDLAGRRVTKPTHGIYIQNGRKVYYK